MEKKIVSYNKRINNLNRTLDLHIFEWGVYAVVKDITDGSVNASFDTRNFKISAKYPTIEDNEVRALKHYKMEDANAITEPIK